MSRNNRAKREAKQQQSYEFQEPQNNVYQLEFKRPSSKPIEALTDNQQSHLTSLLHDSIVISIGPAGTGKTYLSAAVAAEMYMQKHVRQLILTRPAVEAGEKLGFLPGDIDEKYAPYIKPFMKGIVDRIGSNKFQCDFGKNILAEPINFMRGETYDNAIILLDEAQNLTIKEVKLILTRIGNNTKMFISGDTVQCDLDLNGEENGLAWLIRQFRDQQMPFDIIEYNMKDCVRSDLCKMMLKMISNAK
jgi:phosphate starvation-inducible PhoH-like protein